MHEEVIAYARNSWRQLTWRMVSSINSSSSDSCSGLGSLLPPGNTTEDEGYTLWDRLTISTIDTRTTANNQILLCSNWWGKGCCHHNGQLSAKIVAQQLVWCQPTTSLNKSISLWNTFHMTTLCYFRPMASIFLSCKLMVTMKKIYCIAVKPFDNYTAKFFKQIAELQFGGCPTRYCTTPMLGNAVTWVRL